MISDDHKHRVEVLHFGVAHRHGDGWAWLPNEKIFFIGDACVNGPFNHASDGSIAEWNKALGERTEGRTDYPQFSQVLDDPALGCEGAGMCSHSRKDQEVMEWSVSGIPRVRIPVPTEPLPAPLPGHTCLKYPASVVIEEAGERTLEKRYREN